MAKMKRADVEKQMAVNHGRVVNAQKVREMKEAMYEKIKTPNKPKKII